MRVLWVADFNVQQNAGGAQRTNQFVIDEGRKRGIDIIEYNYDSPVSLLEDKYDLVISNNLQVFHQQKNPVMDYIVSHHNHVRYEHDMCFYLSTVERKDICGSAKKNIFLSEFHHKQHQERYGKIYGDVEYVPPFIPTDTFYDMKCEREDKYLYIGLIHYLKGILNLKKEAVKYKDRRFVIVGWSENKKQDLTLKCLPNVELIGKVNHHTMPVIFNKYKTLYCNFDRTHVEPWCRAIGEAVFCGMEVSHNTGNIGALNDIENYGLEKVKEMCTAAPSKFWNLVT